MSIIIWINNFYQNTDDAYRMFSSTSSASSERQQPIGGAPLSGSANDSAEQRVTSQHWPGEPDLKNINLILRFAHSKNIFFQIL